MKDRWYVELLAEGVIMASVMSVVLLIAAALHYFGVLYHIAALTIVLSLMYHYL